MLKIPIEFSASSNSNIEAGFSKLASLHSSLTDKITATSTAFLALKEAFSLGVEVVEKLAEASLAYEAANQKLKTTLEIMGQNSSKEAIKAVNEFSESMQAASGVSDELVTSVVASNVALGMTKEQAMTTTQAALGLAKATGVDLTQANNELVGSLAGHARALKMLSPEIAAMNQMQLAHGAAIDVVAQKYNKFITSDAATTQGTLNRIKVGFEDLTKSIGISFFEGVDLPGHLGEMTEAFAALQDAIAQNKEFFVDLGQVLTWFITDGMEVLIGLFRQLPGVISSTVQVFQGLGDVIIGVVQGALTPFATAIDAILVAYQKVKSMVTGDDSGLKYAEQALNKDFTRWSQNFNSGVKNLIEGGKGLINSAMSVSVSGVPQSGEASPAPGKLGTLNRPLSEQLVQQQADFQKQIQNDALDIAAMGSDAIVSEYTKRTQKIVQLQQDAARKGFDISAQTEALQESLEAKYVDKFHDEQLKQSIAAADAAGQTRDVINLKYQQQLDNLRYSLDQQKQLIDQEYSSELISYQDMIDQKAAADAQYAKGQAEQARLRDQSAMKTTGSASTDQLLGKASSFVGSMQGGLNSMIGQIGQMFGPYGTLIAGIVQIFNQTPKQFEAMVKGLLKAAEDLPKMIAANLPFLVREIPEIMAAGMRSTFSVPFWTDLIKNLWSALKDMFHNFWALIFGGDQIGTAVEAEKKKSISFGANDPNAGNAEFKIKTLNGQGAQAQTFEDTFKDTVQSSGKSFIAYLKEAWDSIITALGDFFARLPKMIWDGLMAQIDLLLKWGTKIWDGLVAAINNPVFAALGGFIWFGFIALVNNPFFQKLGGEIWNGLKPLLDAGLSIFTSFGTAIWNSLKALFDVKTLFGDPSAYFSNLGTSIWNGLKAGLGGLSTIFSDSIKTGVSGLTTYVTKLFNDINPANIFSKMFNISGASGQGKVETALGIDVPFINFAEGGIVPGRAPVAGDSTRNDNVLAMVSPDEGIIPRSKMGPGFNGIMQYGIGGYVGKVVGETISAVKQVISDPLAPLWDLVMPQVENAVMSMFEANKFAEGGVVGGAGFSDSLPSMIKPAVQQSFKPSSTSNSNSTQTINISFNVAAGAQFDKAAVNQAMPQIVESLRKLSKNGTVVVRKNGVY